MQGKGEDSEKKSLPRGDGAKDKMRMKICDCRTLQILLRFEFSKERNLNNALFLNFKRHKYV